MTKGKDRLVKINRVIGNWIDWQDGAVCFSKIELGALIIIVDQLQDYGDIRGFYVISFGVANVQLTNTRPRLVM